MGFLQGRITIKEPVLKTALCNVVDFKCLGSKKNPKKIACKK
jgi:hypothetical protein